MKRVLFLLLLVSIASCKNKENPIAKKEVAVKDPYAQLYGNWVGDFIVSQTDTAPVSEDDFVYSNKINLVIKSIEGSKVYGQSIVAGNSRLLVGEITLVGNKPGFILKEPGDRKDDGRFEFTIDNDSIKGKWFVFNKKYPVWEREFKLTKQEFRYNPKAMLPDDEEYVDWYSAKVDSIEFENEDGSKEMSYSDLYRSASDVITKLNASTTLLKESDLKNLKRLELEIIRNTIFARHGYTFKKKSFRQFFDPVDWYIPVTDNMSGKLTLIEQKNIVLLNRFQKYAEDNYDSFGR